MNDVSSVRAAIAPMPSSQLTQRILILDFDLYGQVGGGQSAYRRLIALRPNDIFYYFRRSEAEFAPRPANTVAIAFSSLSQRASEALPRRLDHYFGVYSACHDMATSVFRQLGRVEFDVVDTPDYNHLGLFIRPALEAEGCRVGTVSLALHGTLSTAWGGGWPTGENDAPALARLRAAERLQFRVVDSRYALSEHYARQWGRVVDLEVNLIDPLTMVDAVTPCLAPASMVPPDLVFAGRREKWKGPDLFVDMAWWIDRSAYNRLLLIGPDGMNRIGHGSADILAGIAKLRGLTPEITGSVPQTRLHETFRQKAVLMLPSRVDTFNLIALEALSHGCPLVLSERSGMAHWLRDQYPALSWTVAGIDCSRTAATRAEHLLRNYDDYRGRVVEVLTRRPMGADVQTLEAMYRPGAKLDVTARQTAIDLAAQFRMLIRTQVSSKRTIAQVGSAMIDRDSTGFLRQTARLARSALEKLPNLPRIGRGLPLRDILLEKTGKATKLSPRTLAQIKGAHDIGGHRRNFVQQPERSSQELEAKIKTLAGNIPSRLVDRVRLFRELARLERRIGRDVVAATYLMRVMRWLGRDVYGDLPFVLDTLQTNGFTNEAEVAAAMFGGNGARCLDLMNASYQRNLTKPELPLAILDDRRGAAVPRVSAIVSMYNAASKLPTLLAGLNQQTIARQGALEVILVDSNSPTDERGAFEAFMKAHDLPVVYAKSEGRETIQAAWNRGIKLARGEYLTFLGVDEGVHPDALRQLANALDHDPSADWAMADSLVTNVDASGVYDSDIMPYDRRGFRQDLVYLETCYLSWVGGLYRRSIHNRFGYYDETFRAAGDTEFKNRIMPHIRSVHVPGLLGVFNNYPEERTTQHPRAEIEDLRAWYLWRTAAGMEYAFGKRNVADAISLFHASLSYRKSFCGHLSTDFDLAAALAEYLASRVDGPAWAQNAQAEMTRMLSLLRNLELMPDTLAPGLTGLMTSFFVYKQIESLQRSADPHRALFGMEDRPHYEAFNDNRYEQHWYSWS